MSYVAVVLVGILGGLAAAVQSQFLGVMEDRVGTLTSTFITYGGGGLAIGLLMLTLRGGRLSEVRDIPWWALTSGLMGLIIVASLGLNISRLGLGAGLTLFTGSSLVLGALIEHYGFFGEARTIDIPRFLGIGLVILGTWLVVRG